jgi:hypothetical protein
LEVKQIEYSDKCIGVAELPFNKILRLNLLHDLTPGGRSIFADLSVSTNVRVDGEFGFSFCQHSSLSEGKT